MASLYELNNNLRECILFIDYPINQPKCKDVDNKEDKKYSEILLN